ncbi:MAG: dihydrofolate reductase family protein, partial [Phycisphaerales bacterium]|nr:dihydrofolate reductase family protein [Phycisphaerales bacterium]
VAGPGLANSLTALDLIDEYRIYLHPVVLGHGTPYFAGPRPRRGRSRWVRRCDRSCTWARC